MVGVNNWSTDNLRLHYMGKNGLEQLTKRGAEEALWALQSDRYERRVCNVTQLIFNIQHGHLNAKSRAYILNFKFE